MIMQAGKSAIWLIALCLMAAVAAAQEGSGVGDQGSGKAEAVKADDAPAVDAKEETKPETPTPEKTPPDDKDKPKTPDEKSAAEPMPLKAAPSGELPWKWPTPRLPSGLKPI